ncbi:MAG: site-specific integrase [Dehalococcoidia bacterium]|nr:site-specific integrase [Dehalococcoidia bacterium]
MTKRGNNEGTIYQRTDGRGVGAVTIDGGRSSPKRKYVYGQTRLEAARKLTEILKSVQDNAPVPSDRLTIAAFAHDWLDSIGPSVRPKTLESYEGTLRIHVIPALGHIRLAKLAPPDLQHFYADLGRAGFAPKSIRNYHSCVHAMLEKAVRLEMIPRNVARLVDLPRVVHRELPMVTPQEARAFLRSAGDHRLEALFVLGITTGARQGELLGLTWNKVHFDDGYIEIRHALQKVNGQATLVEPKTARSSRTVALTSMAMEALRTHRLRQMKESFELGPAWRNEYNLVFTTSIGTPLDKDNVTKREFKAVIKAAGLSAKLRFHDLRHIAASLALSNGTPVHVVSEMLGHSDAAITLRVYAHLIPGAQRQAALALENVLAG